MSDYVAAPDFRLVHLLFGLASSHGKLWCYPSQDKLCQLVGRFHGRRMSRRTANRHLGGLVRDGWLKRLRRHRREPGRGMVLHSTLYTFTRRTLRAFAGLRAGLRFLGTPPARSRGDEPCARSGTISLPIVESHGPAAPSSPPGPRTEGVARSALDDLKAKLAGK